MKQLNINTQPYIIAEYVWIDAFNTTRSKARTLYLKNKHNVILNDIPIWNFDGSSTGQAEGNNSEVILKPVSIFRDPFRDPDGIIVLCSCYDSNHNPLSSNHRHDAEKVFETTKQYEPWFGLEQEYVFYDNKTKRPLGWELSKDPEPQGKYYCSAGADRCFGRDIVEQHYRMCLDIGITISGINGEVMPGQWEYQVGPVEGIDACDQLWIARYIMNRIAESHGVYVDLSSKPMKGDWNGSGCHTNFSTNEMRDEGGLSIIYGAMEKLSKKHREHIEVYGDNKERLTGKHETSSIDKFTYGVADRTASIRIPLQTHKDKKGYFEDRRPAANIDPYLVLSKLLTTILLS